MSLVYENNYFQGSYWSSPPVFDIKPKEYYLVKTLERDSDNPIGFEFYSEGSRRVVVFRNNAYYNLTHLIKENSNLIKNLKTLSILANFFFQGIKYEVLQDPVAFKKNYGARYTFPQSGLELSRRRSSFPGTFDVSKIEDPYLTQEEFVFFVKRNDNEIPYKVSCPFPFHEELSAKYELLPYK
jgi:hypothetical protein